MKKISSYHPNHHDEIRRYYLQKGHCQPVLHCDDYPISYFSRKPRRFISKWYKNRYWLEYSIDKDAVFCFYCYLFGQDVGKEGGGDTFVTRDLNFGIKKRSYIPMLEELIVLVTKLSRRVKI